MMILIKPMELWSTEKQSKGLVSEKNLEWDRLTTFAKGKWGLSLAGLEFFTKSLCWSHQVFYVCRLEKSNSIGPSWWSIKIKFCRDKCFTIILFWKMELALENFSMYPTPYSSKIVCPEFCSCKDVSVNECVGDLQSMKKGRNSTYGPWTLLKTFLNIQYIYWKHFGEPTPLNVLPETMDPGWCSA